MWNIDRPWRTRIDLIIGPCMKAFKNTLLLAFFLILGCTTTKFLPYAGEQQDWATAPGALAEEVDGVPIFHGLPPKPYEIIGSLALERKNWMAPTTLSKAAAEAKERGADAVIMLDQGTRLLGYQNHSSGTAYNSGNFTSYGGSGSSRAVYSQTAQVMLIRYKR